MHEPSRLLNRDLMQVRVTFLRPVDMDGRHYRAGQTAQVTEAQARTLFRQLLVQVVS